MVKFKKSFGRLFGLPKNGKLSKDYLRKCKKDQKKFKPVRKNTITKTKRIGWRFKINKRTSIKKQRRHACY
jgi:hypothetical protein